MGGYCPEDRRCGLGVLILALSALQVHMSSSEAPFNSIQFKSKYLQNSAHERYIGLQVHSCSLLLELPPTTSAVNNLNPFILLPLSLMPLKLNHPTIRREQRWPCPLFTRIAMPRVARHSPSPTHHRSPRKQQSPNTHLRYHSAHYGP